MMNPYWKHTYNVGILGAKIVWWNQFIEIKTNESVDPVRLTVLKNNSNYARFKLKTGLINSKQLLNKCQNYSC